MKKLIVAILFLGLVLYICTASAIHPKTTYRSYVDQDYGFYKVSILDLNRSLSYQNISYEDKTIIINMGDTIEWINYATPDWPITIISQQKLWEDRDAYLRWNYQKFNYMFNDPGIYTVSIKECRRCQNQTIIVGTVEDTTPLVSATVTVTTIPIQIAPIQTIITTPVETNANKIPGFGIVTVIIIIFSMAILIRGGI